MRIPTFQRYPGLIPHSIGAAILSLGLPIVCYAFAFLCNDVSGCPAPSLLSPSKLFTAPMLSAKSGWQHGLDTLKQEAGWPGLTGLINVESVLGTFGWYGLSLTLWALLPAYEVEGTELRSGGRLKYRMNGIRTLFSILTSLADWTTRFLLRRHNHGRLCSRHLGSWSRLPSVDLYQSQLHPAHDMSTHLVLLAGYLCLHQIIPGQAKEQGETRAGRGRPHR